MGLFSKDRHGLPKGTVDRPKGSQKGIVARDHQKGLLFSDKPRSWVLGAPAKYKGKR